MPTVTNLKEILTEGAKVMSEKEVGVMLSEVTKTDKVVVRVPLAYAVLGFIRFLKGYYLVLVTGRKRVAKIGRHSIYSVKKTEMISLFTATAFENRDQENAYCSLF